MLPGTWQRPTKQEPPAGYSLVHMDGGQVDGEPALATIDEALRRAARHTRLDPSEPVVVRETAPPKRVRAVAQVGVAWWVTACPTCLGRGQHMSMFASGWHDCDKCAGVGWVTDLSMAAARG